MVASVLVVAALTLGLSLVAARSGCIDDIGSWWDGRGPSAEPASRTADPDEADLDYWTQERRDEAVGVTPTVPSC